MDTFISSIFAQFRIIHVLDAWGMFAQGCAVMPHPLCRRILCISAYNIIIVYLDTYLDTPVAYQKYYRKLWCEIVYDDYYIII